MVMKIPYDFVMVGSTVFQPRLCAVSVYMIKLVYRTPLQSYECRTIVDCTLNTVISLPFLMSNLARL